MGTGFNELGPEGQRRVLEGIGAPLPDQSGIGGYPDFSGQISAGFGDRPHMTGEIHDGYGEGAISQPDEKQLLRVRDQAIDMGDFETADQAQYQLNRIPRS